MPAKMERLSVTLHVELKGKDVCLGHMMTISLASVRWW